MCNNITIEKLSFILFHLKVEMLIYDYLDTCRASLNLVEKTWLRSKRFNDKWQQKIYRLIEGDSGTIYMGVYYRIFISALFHEIF